MNAIKTFFNTLLRNKTASILTLLGLTVAFAAFTILMTQVRYDLTFDRHYVHAEKLFRIELTGSDIKGLYDAPFNRKLGDALIATPAPEIEKTGIFTEGGYSDPRIYDASRDLSAAVDNIPYGFASRGLLDLFELQCVAGSFDRFEEPNVTVLSQSAAELLFGGKEPVGQSLVFPGENDKQPMEVIGVYKDQPKNSSFRPGALLFVGDMDIHRDNEWGYTYFVRLSDPGAVEKITQMMQARSNGIYNNDNYAHRKDIALRLHPVVDLHFAKDTQYDDVEKASRTTVDCLLAVAILILSIAMINFINFSIALVPFRIRRINTQRVVGASRASIRRSIVSEAATISLIAFLLSIVVVQLFASSPLASLVSSTLPVGSDISLLLLTGGVALACGILSGVYPAFYSTSFPPALILKGTFGLSARGRMLRTALISFQYVISIGLIIVAISIHLQNRFMRDHDTSFHRENILVTDLPLSVATQYKAFADKLRSNPHIAEVTFTEQPIVTNQKSQWALRYKNGQSIHFSNYSVAPNFIHFMGLKILEGRDFTETDLNTYIFNRTADRQYHLTIGDRTQDNGSQIVGIVEDFNFRPMQYRISPMGLLISDWATLCHAMIKVAPENADKIPQVIAFIKRATREFDATAKNDVTFLDESIGRLYEKEDNLSAMITLFSLVSILISIVGVFGLTLFETQLRSKEIGVRKVFGATVDEVLAMFNKTYVRIVAACFVVAAPLAWYTVHLYLEGFAYKTPIRWWVFLAALLVVLLITVLTVTIQTYRAATENPAKAIKTE